MKKTLIVVAILFFIAYQCDKKWQKFTSDTENQTEEKHCKRCSKDLTNDVNRIYSNGGYYCTPCWKTTQREIQQELKYEGY